MMSPASAQRPGRAPEGKLVTEALVRVDTAGQFEGYASLFNIPDLGKDLVEPGAFAVSLARRGVRGIKLLWQHDPSEPLGQWLVLREDARGLFVRGRLSLDVARAREILALMRDGAVDGLSIGFRTVKARSDPRTGYRRLSEIDLWEVSLVTFPLLPQARVSAGQDWWPCRAGQGSAGRLTGSVRIHPPITWRRSRWRQPPAASPRPKPRRS